MINEIRKKEQPPPVSFWWTYLLLLLTVSVGAEQDMLELCLLLVDLLDGAVIFIASIQTLCASRLQGIRSPTTNGLLLGPSFLRPLYGCKTGRPLTSSKETTMPSFLVDCA